MHFSERYFPKASIKKMNNKRSTSKKKEELIFAPWGLLTCLEMGMATISKFNTNLNSVPMIVVLKIQKDLSTRSQLILSTETILSTNRGQWQMHSILHVVYDHKIFIEKFNKNVKWLKWNYFNLFNACTGTMYVDK